jgi:RND family efflux transporter MFP subunit
MKPRNASSGRINGRLGGALAVSVALIALSGLAIVLYPGAFAQSDQAARTGMPGPLNGESSADAAIRVSVRPLAEVIVQPERDAPAQVVARNESKVAAEQMGIILEWSADAGETVRRGQLIAQLDPRDAELGVQRAQAALDAALARERLAITQLRRARELVTQGFFSQESLTQRETETAVLSAEVNAARVQLATARRQLDKTRILAPFDGVVRERLAQRGESVAPGSVLFLISERGANELSATVNPAEAEGLRQSESARFVALGQTHPVRLLRISSAVSNTARTQSARLEFVQPAKAPPAGLSGTLIWRDARPHLPASLPVRRDGALGVFVVETSGPGGSSVARFKPLPGAQEARANPVTLPADTLIVVSGQMGLRDGDRLSWSESERGPAVSPRKR